MSRSVGGIRQPTDYRRINGRLFRDLTPKMQAKQLALQKRGGWGTETYETASPGFFYPEMMNDEDQEFLNMEAGRVQDRSDENDELVYGASSTGNDNEDMEAELGDNDKKYQELPSSNPAATLTSREKRRSTRQAGRSKKGRPIKSTKPNASLRQLSPLVSSSATVRLDRNHNQANRPPNYATPKILAATIALAARAGSDAYPKEHAEHFPARHPNVQNPDGTETPGTWKTNNELEAEIDAADSSKQPRRRFRAWHTKNWIINNLRDISLD